MLGYYITGFEPGFGYFLFSLVVAGGLCGGYVLLGATWLILRTEGELQRKAIGWTRWGLLWVALGVALVSIATPLASETVRDEVVRLPAHARTHAAAGRERRGLVLGLARHRAASKRGEPAPEWAPFAGAVAIYVLAFLGLAYSLFPYVVIDRHHHLGSRGAPLLAQGRARRSAHRAAVHHRLHRVLLPRVPRQGRVRHLRHGMAYSNGTLALAVSGGGARAAYQVGFLRCVAEHYPHLSIPILTGVSAGAINTAYLANHQGTFREKVKDLAALWETLTLDRVFRVDARHDPRFGHARDAIERYLERIAV